MSTSTLLTTMAVTSGIAFGIANGALWKDRKWFALCVALAAEIVFIAAFYGLESNLRATGIVAANRKD